MSDRICLIVDDEPSIRAYIRAVLERERFQSMEADTASQALRVLEKLGGSVDLVISDINMPGEMSGIDLAYSLRNSFPYIPIILISGYADDKSVKRAAASFDFIQKPFAPTAILNAVSRALKPQRYGIQEERRSGLAWDQKHRSA